LLDGCALSSVKGMRNPIRLKNLSVRFLPFYCIGAGILFFRPPQPEGLVLALPLIAAGAALRGWGAGHLVKNAELTTSGPYAHLRHPLYLGTIMTATGFAIWVGGWLAMVVLSLAWPWFAFHYFPRKERVESDRLEAAYGEHFLRYQRAVPALWPRLHAWRFDHAIGSRVPWTLDRYSENNELGTLLALSFGVLLFWWRGSMTFG
jgi:protein-S-isoprenylcysteine O-methyltransferase Ste14